MVIQICYTDQKGRTEDSEMVIAKRARIMGEGKVAMNSLIERTCNINPKPSKVETTATKTGRDCGNQGVSRPLHHLRSAPTQAFWKQSMWEWGSKVGLGNLGIDSVGRQRAARTTGW